MMRSTVSILDVIQDKGINLSKKGKAYMGSCPFHQEKTPSFAVYPDSGRYYCYGCHEHGDSIDFVRKLKGLSFKEALSYLGVEKDYQGHKNKREESKWTKKKTLVEAFRRWEKDYYDELCTLYRTFNKLKGSFKTMEEAAEFSIFYHQMPIWEYHMDILISRDDADKYRLFKELNYGEL